jgi:hypothetical protein
MPANFSARAFLWIGIALIVASAILQVAIDLVFGTAGQDELQSLVNSWWFTILSVTRTVIAPLAPLMLAAYFVARLIERSPGPSSRPAHRITALWVFVAGVVFTLLGVLIGVSLDGWLGTLNAQRRTSLALDLLNLVVVPLRGVVFPLGLALLPAAALMKMLESRAPVEAPVEPRAT